MSSDIKSLRVEGVKEISGVKQNEEVEVIVE